MKLICKIDHISLPVGSSYQLLQKNQTIELSDQEAYALLAKFSDCLEKEPDTLKTKEVSKIEQVK